MPDTAAQTENSAIPTDILHELVLSPEATKAESFIGGSHVAATLDDLEERNEEIWTLLNPAAADSPPPAPTALALPSQLGPFTWSPIVFGGGVPVGGWAQLTLFRNGAYNYVGHFHDSGASSYNMACAYAVKGRDGIVFTFSHQGRVHGTFESGSRDDNWNVGGSNPALAASWAALCASYSWRANAAANFNFGALLDSTIKALGTAAAIIAIV